eukprot:537970_1
MRSTVIETANKSIVEEVDDLIKLIQSIAESVDDSNSTAHNQLISNNAEYQCIDRVIETIRYYEQLNIENKIEDRNQLVHFCEDYNNKNVLLDDCNEITSKYKNASELETIYNMFIKNKCECDLENCFSFQRHHKIINTKNTETKVRFYIELFDAIHCYLWHPWDSGMRVQKNNITATQNVRDIVKAKQKKIVDRFGNKMKEFDAAKQEKFTVKKDKLDMKTNETFVDILCQIINDDNKAVQSIYNAIENEEYDTDAITMDITDYYTEETQIISSAEKYNVVQKKFMISLKPFNVNNEHLPLAILCIIGNIIKIYKIQMMNILLILVITMDMRNMSYL